MSATPTLDKYPLAWQALHDVFAFQKDNDAELKADNLAYFEGVAAILDASVTDMDKETAITGFILTSAPPHTYGVVQLLHVQQIYGTPLHKLVESLSKATERDDLASTFKEVRYYAAAEEIYDLNGMAGLPFDDAALARMRNTAAQLKQGLIPVDNTDVRLRTYAYAAYGRILAAADTQRPAPSAPQQTPPQR